MVTKKKPTKKLSARSKAVKKPEVKNSASAKNVQPTEKMIKWRAPDYYSNKKGPIWSLMVGLVAVLFALLLIYTGNYLAVVIVILAVIVAFQTAHEKPQTVEFAIDESGVISRDQYYPFDELESFWISKHQEKKFILYLETASPWKGPLTIPLGQQSVTEVKAFLLGHLPEEFNYGEMFSDKLIRIFKL